MRTAPILLALTLSLISLADARAQGTDDQAYGQALARDLQSTHGAEVMRVERPGVTGLRVLLGGTCVERLEFATPEAAQAHARRVSEATGGDPVAGEVRGALVLLVRGAKIGEPSFARRALAAAREHLPVPATLDQAFANLGDGDARRAARFLEALAGEPASVETALAR